MCNKMATKWQSGYNEAKGPQKSKIFKKTNVWKNYNTPIKGTLRFSKNCFKSYLL